jgi:hypothetical protein
MATIPTLARGVSAYAAASISLDRRHRRRSPCHLKHPAGAASAWWWRRGRLAGSSVMPAKSGGDIPALARELGAAMCSACWSGSHDRWPQCPPRMPPSQRAGGRASYDAAHPKAKDLRPVAP